MFVKKFMTINFLKKVDLKRVTKSKKIRLLKKKALNEERKNQRGKKFSKSNSMKNGIFMMWKIRKTLSKNSSQSLFMLR
jgi:hypothetical protein